MDEFTIQCTVCDGTFSSEKEYNDHGCTDNDTKLSIKIKLEPEDEMEEDSLCNLKSNAEMMQMTRIKSEPMEEEAKSDDDVPVECRQRDPLEIQSGDNKIIGNDERDELLNDTEENDINKSKVGKGQRTKNQLPFTYLKDFSCRCKLCDNLFSTKEEFVKHFREMHKSFRPFECGICGKKFLHRHYVNLHMRVHTGEKPYACQLCPRAYSHKTSFTIHMRIHNGERPYACEVCGKKCYDKSGLTSHMRSHTKETPYQCEVCGRRFTHSKSLLVHRRNHTGEKPYVCSYCGKAFRHWHKHKIHVRLHTGERPYKCKVCGKGFPRNDEVSRHMRSHQGIKSFKCSICGVYCATQASITGHINLHHYNLKAECDEQPPEKTLVKDSTSGILGSKAPEPRSLYRLATKITGSTSVLTGVRSVPEPNIMTNALSDKMTMKDRLSTRVIEITSRDTPINIPQNAKKTASKKINCILPKPKTTMDAGENKMNYQEFLKWQERMLANQGLVVKGFPSSNSKTTTTTRSTNTNTQTTSTNFSTSATTTSTATNNSLLASLQKNQTTVSSSGSKVNKPQYLLLSQGGEGNGTKILLPLNMLEQNSLLKNNPTPATPQTLSIPNSTVGTQGNRSMLLLPQIMNSQQPLLLLSSGGQRMLLMPSQNVIKPNPPPIPDIKEETFQIKEENEIDSIFAPEITIKTEMDDDSSEISPSEYSAIKIKEEPKDI